MTNQHRDILTASGMRRIVQRVLRSAGLFGTKSRITLSVLFWGSILLLAGVVFLGQNSVSRRLITAPASGKIDKSRVDDDSILSFESYLKEECNNSPLYSAFSAPAPLGCYALLSNLRTARGAPPLTHGTVKDVWRAAWVDATNKSSRDVAMLRLRNPVYNGDFASGISRLTCVNLLFVLLA